MSLLSIVVVSLNAGDRLEKTLHSIAKQSYRDYEVIIKDGGSTDGSIEKAQESDAWTKLNQVRLIVEKDRSIYDGMNQAVKNVTGKYVQFLNCGDYFSSEHVLRDVVEVIIHTEKEIQDKVPLIFYGDQYNQIQNCKISSVPEINDFALFRNVPCHQVCFYDARLFSKRAYKIEYSVRADYEHFLYCIYEEHAKAVHMDIVVCDYEGGGYSETKENRLKSKEQHREITAKYLGVKAKKYRLIMFMTLSGLRTRLAESKRFSKIYNALKSCIYRR